MATDLHTKIYLHWLPYLQMCILKVFILTTMVTIDLHTKDAFTYMTPRLVLHSKRPQILGKNDLRSA